VEVMMGEMGKVVSKRGVVRMKSSSKCGGKGKELGEG